MIVDKIVFFREFLAEFEATGSFFPTSRWAASALTCPLRGSDAKKRILEVGAGTGAVTTRILRDMNDQDELTICELNPRLMKSLKARLKKNDHFKAHAHRVTFFEGPVQDLPDTEAFDVIVCAIPFLNLSRQVVEDIFKKLSELSHHDTIMTYYEYVGMKSLSKTVALPERKRRVSAVEEFFDSRFADRHANRQRVWLNVLPINIYTISLAA